MSKRWQKFARASWKLFLGCVWLLVSLLGCQMPPPVQMETVPCPAAQSQVQVSRLGQPAGGNEPAETTLYVGLSTWLYALDTGSGRPRWCRLLRSKDTSYSDLLGFMTITRAGQNLYANTADGYLLVLNAQDGTVRWGAEDSESLDDGWGVPAVDKAAGLVYRRDVKAVEALAVNDGQSRWSYQLPQKEANRTTTGVKLMPLVGEGMVYVVGDDLLTVPERSALVVALDARTGQPRWQRSFPEGRDQQPMAMVLGNGVLCLDLSQGVIAIDANDGRQLWQASGSRWLAFEYRLLAAGQGWLYVAKDVEQEQKLQVSALRLADGEEGWSVELPGDFGFDLAPVQGVLEGKVLYLLDGQGQLTALDGQSGRVLWQFLPVTSQEPGLRPSRLIVGKSEIYLFTTESGGLERFVLHALAKESGQEEWKIVLPLPLNEGEDREPALTN
ncbi:MAG: PQQ-binding-like beta-propeller repeat protein [Thermogemmatispora sp.]|uniref:outer membrane protein assembly factor BamB family protein n=1 Tax=Thermogemmatispora sp. TaxID=1968838 RepID=UPI001D840745|nr:PQQ-binding-like beta-propeller repeat protein [Thermogemmatispora sp.]MBX5449379.1 PQQ-binding-like beta-propeller repeat protein [Thermogemmatispora sp.]